MCAKSKPYLDMKVPNYLIKALLTTGCLLIVTVYGFSQVPAFPGAEGYGKYAQGGRGGDVYKVTNLNDSGPGSFREACEANGPRTIIFEIGGRINLSSTVAITNPFITIAGQTAPGDGVTLSMEGTPNQPVLGVYTNNVIIRYITIRRSKYEVSEQNSDGLVIAYAHDVIVDHCSFSWASDENIAIYDYDGNGNADVYNITIQNSLIATAWGGSDKGIIVSGGVDKISFYKNVFASVFQRQPLIKNETGNYVTDETYFEVVNNVIFGGKFKTSFPNNVQESGLKHLNYINNVFRNPQGSSYTRRLLFVESAFDVSIFAQGNISPIRQSISIPTDWDEEWNVTQGTDDNGGITAIGESNSYPFADAGFQSFTPKSTPIVDDGVQLTNAIDLFDELKDHVGASFPTRDSYDIERIEDVESLINTASSTSGTFPIIENGEAPEDDDEDGMPNNWENDNNLNIDDPSDRNIVNPDGYTNLEYYLNWILLGNQVSAGADVSICEGESVTLAASGANSYLWSTGETTQSIIVNPTASNSYSVIGTHGDGSTTSDSVEVIVNEVPNINAGEDVDLCLGSSITLTATGGSNYLWSTGETTQSIEVTPNEDTTYSVTVLENGCEASDEVIVFVQELPTAYAGEDVMIVQGQPTTLTASGGGTYLWSTGETTQSIVVSPDVSTTYEVTVNVNGCQDSDEVMVTLMDQVAADAGEDETICIGSSVTLTASGGDTYTWNTGETTQSITVSPSEDTIYTVTAIIGNESDSDSVTVFVNPLPEANAGEDITINEGDSGILTASGGDSYLWNTGETTQSINVNPTVDVTFTVTVYQNGCENTDSVNVFVNPAAEANAGDDIAICNGEQTTLTATGGDFYLWSTGETTQSINVAPTNTTNYSVIVSNDFSTDTDEVTVFVNPLPEVEVSGDVSIMQGEFVTLSASGANTYEWSNGATLPNIAVSPSETTTYTVMGYINNCADMNEVTVSVFDEVVADAGNDISICLGESVTLSASGGDSFVWSTGETTQTIEVSPEEDTLYTVIVANELDSDTDSIEVFVSDCITEEINDALNYQLFISSNNPNILNLSLAGLNGDASIAIHDLTGKLLYSENFENNNGQSFVRQLDISNYAKTIYLVTLKEQNRETTKKVIFQN